jgi:hypothetical protein
MNQDQSKRDGAAPVSSTPLLAAAMQSAEARRDLLMEARRKTAHIQDRDNLQWRAQAMDDLAEVIREVIKAANYLFRRKVFGLSVYWSRNAELLATALLML